ncbi:serine dehydratase beta chain [Nocardia carnea]|nr:serine dehydratase beta chain [Nocardia carnea]
MRHALSVFDLFSVGVGPSNSHGVEPIRTVRFPRFLGGL